MRTNSDPTNKLKSRNAGPSEKKKQNGVAQVVVLVDVHTMCFLYLRDLNRPSTAPNTHKRICWPVQFAPWICFGVRCSQPYIRSHSFANRARKISRIRKRDETTTIPAADCSTLDSRTHQRRTTIFICTKLSRRLQFEFVARPKNNTFFITSNICPRSLAGLKYIFFPLLTTISSSNAVSCHRFYYNNFVSRVFVMVL